MDSDSGSLTGLAILAILLLLDFVMTAFAAALEAASEAELQEDYEARGRDFKPVFALKRDTARIRHTIWLLHTVTCVCAGYLSVRMAGPVPAAAVLLVSVLLFYLIGNAVPDLLGRRKALRWLRLAYPLAGRLVTVLSPFTYALTAATNLCVRVFGVDPKALEQEVTEDEIISMVNEGHEQGVLDAGEAELIQKIFEFSDKKAEDIMTRRKHMICISGATTLQDAIAFMLEQTVSRFPVYDESIDNITGVLHFRDAMKFRAQGAYDDWLIKDVPGLLRDVRFIPETRGIYALFRSMQAEKLQMVTVIDEYGQTAGLVTMEDILEEIVGNIQDEYDDDEQLIRREANGSYLMDGMAPLEDVTQELGLVLEEDEAEYDTLNGLLISRLDRIPSDGEQAEVEAGGYRFQILKVENKMIRLVKITKQKEEKE